MNLKMTAYSLAATALLQMAQAATAGNATPISAPAENPARPGYTVHELGSVEGGLSDARSVSSNGKAAGYVTFNIDGSFRPALFELGKLPVPIYTDGPGKATGVNAGGEVVGWYAQGAATQAFRWKNNTLTTLPTLGGSSWAAAINDRSEIVGWSEVSPGVVHAAYFYAGKVRDLGTWGGLSAQATGINANGDIVGFREVMRDGVRVRQGVRVLRGQAPQLLRPPAGFDALVPQSINANGDVAGYLHKAGGLSIDTQAFTLVGTQLRQLRSDGCCNGAPSSAGAINAARQTVGHKLDAGADPRQRGRLWLNAQPVALDTLPEAAAAGWYALGEATSLNDRGVIVGVGQTAQRQVRAYMLVPKP
jgi:probable HAF family extracellular repeat protein